MAVVGSPSDPLKDLVAEFARMVYPLKRDNVSLVPGQKTPLLMFGYIQFPRWNELGQLIAGDDGRSLRACFRRAAAPKTGLCIALSAVSARCRRDAAGTICEAAWLAGQREKSQTCDPPRTNSLRRSAKTPRSLAEGRGG